MKECKIVQDLLEIYIEDLTTGITNDYIEKHLRYCNKSKRKLEKIRNVTIDKRECAIIQDLLPNYIEKLTYKTTNKYIQEHLKICKECTQALEDMTSTEIHICEKIILPRLILGGKANENI